jgi:histidinol-phosphate aminotransferase
MSLPFAVNPFLANLPAYQPGRPIEEVAREVGLPASEIIKLASNENPLGPSPAALAAMRAALENLHLYPDGSAFYLKQKLAEKLGVQPSNLIFGNGSNEILEFVGHAFLQPGTNVVMSQYCFVVYPIVTHLFGAEPIVVPAREYGHDSEALLKAITSKTRVLFVANPNNPTGTLLEKAEILRLVHQTPRNVVLAMDEAYIEFLEDAVDLVSLVRSGDHPNLLLMRTFSKIYGLAGLRLGYGIAHPELIQAFEKVRQPFNINSLIQAGAIAALDDLPHLQNTRRNNRQGLEFFGKAFQAIGLEFVPSSANFIMLKVGDGQRVCTQMQKLGVITRPMAGYQLPEWIRISVGTPAENARCLSALKQVLNKS